MSTLLNNSNLVDILCHKKCIVCIIIGLYIQIMCYRIPRLGINASGVYRRLLAYPKQLSWRWCEPYTPTTSQCVTPLDEVKGQTIAQSDEVKSYPKHLYKHTIIYNIQYTILTAHNLSLEGRISKLISAFNNSL